METDAAARAYDQVLEGTFDCVVRLVLNAEHLPGEPDISSSRPRLLNQCAPQHFLYFFPLPHGQGALRPTFGSARTAAPGLCLPAGSLVSRHPLVFPGVV